MLEQLGAIEVESRAGSPHTREQSDTTESVRLSQNSRNLGDRTVDILSSSKYNHTSYMIHTSCENVGNRRKVCPSLARHCGASLGLAASTGWITINVM